MHRVITYLSALFILLSHISQIAAREIIFSADFDNGSLGTVDLIAKKPLNDSTYYLHYAIKTKFDPESPIAQKAIPNNRWFYFCMRGCKGCEVALNIDYNDSRRAQYSYDNKIFHRFTNDEIPKANGKITKRFDHDTVYIAYHEPYGSDHFAKAMERWSALDCCKKTTIGHSGEGRPIEMLIVSDSIHNGLVPDSNGMFQFSQSDKGKSIVYIHSRIHPSESPASWHLESLVDKLTNGDSYSRMTLSNTIFYIIPNINPDGVALGYSRSNAIGVNMEVNYDHKEEQTMAEIKCIKALHRNFKRSGITPTLALNLHSQSAAKACYWIHSAETTDKDYNRQQRTLALLTTLNNPYFKWSDMSYSRYNPIFIEGWLYKQNRGETTAITFETPYSYYSLTPKGEWVTSDNLSDFSQYNLDAINHFIGGEKDGYYYAEEPRRNRSCRRKKSGDLIFFEKSYLKAGKKAQGVSYNVTLPQGEYNVYRWSPTAMRWLHDGEVRQYADQPSNIEYMAQVSYCGEIFDRIIFVSKELSFATLSQKEL